MTTLNTKMVELEMLKNKIENMGKIHHIEILKILKKSSSVKLNENKSGVFVNLSFIPNDTIDEVKEYLNYINMQENALLTTEMQKEEFKKTFFHNEERA
jgi:hypothetical protein